jgi:hypothetical protein
MIRWLEKFTEHAVLLKKHAVIRFMMDTITSAPSQFLYLYPTKIDTSATSFKTVLEFWEIIDLPMTLLVISPQTTPWMLAGIVWDQ